VHKLAAYNTKNPNWYIGLLAEAGWPGRDFA